MIFDGIAKFGFKVIFVLIVMCALYKLWKVLYENLLDRIEKLEVSNEEFRKEINQSLELSNKEFESFNKSIKTFQNIDKKLMD